MSRRARNILNTPTCGWQYYTQGDKKGQRIPNSQGFCCECPIISTQKNQVRGEVCAAISWEMGSESAHCLRFSEKEKRYKGYTMSSPILDYEMRF